MGKNERFTCRCSVEAYPFYLDGDKDRDRDYSHYKDIKIKISMEAPDQPLYLLLKDPGVLYEETKNKEINRFDILDI